MDLTALSQHDLDEYFAQNPNSEEAQAEYVRRGIDPETGEPIAA